MRGNPLLLLTAVFLLTVSAVVAPHAAAQVPTGSASLSGTACVATPYRDTSDPALACGNGTRVLPDTQLHLTKPGTVAGLGAVDKQATAGKDGRYAFSNLPTGDYVLEASRTGFQGVTQKVTVSGATTLDAALSATAVVLSGKVQGKDGTAIPGAQVSSCCLPDGGYVPPATTGKDGAYTLRVSTGYTWFNVNQARGFVDLGEERFVDGAATVDFRLDRVPPQDATLQGTVKDQDGNPVPDLRIDVSSYQGYPNSGYGYATPASEPSSGPSGSAGSGSASTTTSPPSDGMVKPSYLPPAYGGSNYTVTDAAGRYAVHVYGGSSVSLNAQKEGYAPFSGSRQVAQGETATFDFTLQKYPPKTAHLVGQVVDGDGKPVPYVSISVRSPLYGLSECSQSADQAGSSSATVSASSGPDGRVTILPYPYPSPSPGCALTVQDDGRFAGDVTPGYAVIQVYADSYRACQAKGVDPGSQGSNYGTGACGPEYLSWTRTLTLAKDGTTEVRVELRARPTADAVVSGYLVDAATGKAIPNAQISFSNEEASAYGSATTDQDGSYKIRLLHGYHSVSAYAEGHLSWQGNLEVQAGDQPFDVKLEPGQEANGGCCYGCYDCRYEAVAASDGAKGAPAAATASMASSSTGPAAGLAQSGAGGANGYEDLHGGLGPYDAAARAKTLDGATSKGSPTLQVAAVLAVLAVGAFLVRRKLD